MRRIVLALALSVTLVPQAFAWNPMGHMMVAAAAYEQLKPAVRARAMHLLQLNPAYKQWSAGAKAKGPAKDELIFMQAALWADDIRSRTGYTNDGETPQSADAAAQGYADMQQHRYWHFVNAPIPIDHRADPGPAPTPNAATQIGVFRKSLASDATDEVKSYELVWLLNLVGDVHEPLHTATRITKSTPKGDDNGRLVTVCRAPCRNSLFDYWENLFGTGRNPQAALAAAHALPKPFAKLSQVDDETQWAADSTHLAQTVVYSLPVGTGSGPYVLDVDYHNAALPVARQQLALAGFRLAHLLNEQLVN